MIAEAFADYGKITVAEARAYLEQCDEIVKLPFGALVRRGNIVHIVARQPGLSGRQLVSETRKALLGFHRSCGTLRCPIRHENTRALKYAKHFGFRQYEVTDSHQWLYRLAGDAL